VTELYLPHRTALAPAEHDLVEFLALGDVEQLAPWVAGQVAHLGVDVRTLSGDPGSELLDVAEREGFDQIVLGGGQRSPMGKIKLGHIAEFVLLNSHVTVKLVRES